MSTNLVEHPAFAFDSELPYNTGLVAFRADRLKPARTTVVTGTPRGGTTMVAECLGVLGLPLGVPVPAPPDMFDYEDPELQAVLHTTQPSPVDLNCLRELVTPGMKIIKRYCMVLIDEAQRLPAETMELV